MKKIGILIFAIFGFAACESSEEQHNPFEGMPTGEIVAQEGGIEYLISISEPCDTNDVVDLLKSGKALYSDCNGYYIEDGCWKSEILIGASPSYFLWINENTLRIHWDYYISGVLLKDGQPVDKVYKDDTYEGDLGEAVWDWVFYGPTDVKVRAYVNDLIFLTCTNHYGKLDGRLLRICDDCEQTLSEYVNIDECTERFKEE